MLNLINRSLIIFVGFFIAHSTYAQANSPSYTVNQPKSAVAIRPEPIRPSGLTKSINLPGIGASIFNDDPLSPRPRFNSKVYAEVFGEAQGSGIFVDSKKQPILVDIQKTVPCLRTVFLSMGVGSAAVVQCHPVAGYGKAGAGKVPPNAHLTFSVKLISIKDK